MPIDRRTFVFGSGVAAAGAGALASLGAIAAVEQHARQFPPAAVTPMGVGEAPSFGLRIVGWDRSEDLAEIASTRDVDAAAWISIDRQWRGAWH